MTNFLNTINLKIIVCTLLIFQSMSSFSQHWIKKEAPDQLGILLVERFDTVGKLCDNNQHLVVRNENPFSFPVPPYKGKMYYCSIPEKDLDQNVGLYRAEQEQLFKKALFAYQLVDKKQSNSVQDSTYKDIEKYKYILRPMPCVDWVNGKPFPKWGYVLINRKTDHESEIYMNGASSRFSTLKHLMDDLNDKYGAK